MLKKEKLDISILEGETEVDYFEELKASEETINEDLKNQPSLYAFYGILDENAEAHIADCKLTLELVESELDQKFRKAAEENKSKTTEVQISNMIKSDELRIAAVEEVNKAKALQGKLHVIREAFAQRKETIISLASNLRAQRDTTLQINDKKERL